MNGTAPDLRPVQLLVGCRTFSNIRDISDIHILYSTMLAASTMTFIQSHSPMSPQTANFSTLTKLSSLLGRRIFSLPNPLRGTGPRALAGARKLPRHLVYLNNAYISSTKGQAGVIAGGIAGALSGIALFILAFYICSRRKARQSSNSQWDTSTTVEGGIQLFPNGSSSRPFLTIQTKAGPDWQARGDSAYAPQQGSGWTMRSMRSGSQPGIMSSTNDAAVYLTYENTAVGSDRSRVFPIDSKYVGSDTYRGHDGLI